MSNLPDYQYITNLLIQKRPDDAIIILDKIHAEKSANMLEGAKYYVLAYSQKRDYDACIKYNQILLDENPNEIQYLIAQGKFYRCQKDYARAISCFEKCLDLSPHNYDILELLYGIYSDMGKPLESLRVIERVYELPPKKMSKDEMNNKGIILAFAEYKSKLNMILEKVIANFVLQRIGECNSCNGEDCCCRGINLIKRNGLPVRSNDDLKEIKGYDSRNDYWVHISTDDNGAWRFTCKHLGNDGLCNNYENRSTICRDYPNSIKLLDKCSYKFVKKDNIPQFESFKLVDHIVDYFKENKGYDDVLAEMEKQLDRLKDCK